MMEAGHAGRVYGAAYDVAGALPRPLKEVDLWNPKELLADLPTDTAVAGSQVAAELEEIAAHGLRSLVAEKALRVRASTLAILAHEHLRQGIPAHDPLALEPLYLQPSAPERLAGPNKS
ncbi:MAG: hypothetical protein GY953_34550 [bacterium]|nr:hypothetical protein [bacterium]